MSSLVPRFLHQQDVADVRPVEAEAQIPPSVSAESVLPGHPDLQLDEPDPQPQSGEVGLSIALSYDSSCAISRQSGWVGACESLRPASPSRRRRRWWRGECPGRSGRRRLTQAGPLGESQQQKDGSPEHEGEA